MSSFLEDTFAFPISCSTPESPPGMPSNYTIKLLRDGYIQAAYELETESYPLDEAATLDGMVFRQKTASEYFYGLYDEGTLIGFVNGTCCQGDKLHHETMSQHDPEGTTLCIHSVVIRPELRRKGLATVLLKEYIQKVMYTTAVMRIRLLAHSNLVGLYQGCGFTFLRVSPVIHGSESWFELGLDRVDLLKVHPFVQVDAFTTHAFGGNPAAVAFCQEEESSDWMQKWASEINLSETSFVTKLPTLSPAEIEEGGGSHDDALPSAEKEQEGAHDALVPTSSTEKEEGGRTSSLTEKEDEEGATAKAVHYALRWFTPILEVDLCGHATLAAAHALWITGRVLVSQTIAFHTKSGILTASKTKEGGWIELDFPAEPATEVALAAGGKDFDYVLEAYECEKEDIQFLGRNRFDLLVVLSPDVFHKALNIDILNQIDDVRGVIVTCVGREEEEGGQVGGAGEREGASSTPSSPTYDFHSRFFAPRCGIREDPVTGSAHCCLGPYWAKRLGKNDLLAHQDSQRGGVIKVYVDDINQRVKLGGQAVLMKQGYLAAGL